MLSLWNTKTNEVLVPAEGSYDEIARDAIANPNVQNRGQIFPLTTDNAPPPCELPSEEIMRTINPMADE